MIKKDRKKLGLILLERSYKEGSFTLTSGKISKFYIDIKQTFLDPQGSILIGKCFWEIIKNYCPKATAVAGVPVGATPLVTATSIMSFLDQSYKEYKGLAQGIVRKNKKDHGSSKQIEFPQSVKTGATVVILDDVLTTGKTIGDAVSALTAVGFKVGLITVVVDREEGGREFLIRKTRIKNIHSIFTRNELLALKT